MPERRLLRAKSSGPRLGEIGKPVREIEAPEPAPVQVPQPKPLPVPVPA
jgi:hypothetical protein